MIYTSIDYSGYGIKGVNICTAAPNMNAFVERVNGSIRREALDHFLLISEKQIRKIMKSYVDYYNHQRPHQGVGKIPYPNFVWSPSFILPLKCLNIEKAIGRGLLLYLIRLL